MRLVLTLFALLCAPVVSAQDQEQIPCTRLADDALVSMDLAGLSLTELTRVIGCWTGKRFLLAADPPGHIRVLSVDQMSVREAWKAYLHALDVNGLTIVKRGKFHRIVPKTKARATGAGLASAGPMLTEFWRVDHLPIRDARDLLRLFAGPGADVSTYPAQRTLIVTARKANLERMKAALTQLDSASAAQRVFVRTLSRPDPGELVETLRGVERSLGAGANPKLTLVGDSRTGRITVVGARGDYHRLDGLVRRLQARPSRDRRLYHLDLKNADARRMKALLEQIGGQGRSHPPRRRKARVRGR